MALPEQGGWDTPHLTGIAEDHSLWWSVVMCGGSHHNLKLLLRCGVSLETQEEVTDHKGVILSHGQPVTSSPWRLQCGTPVGLSLQWPRASRALGDVAWPSPGLQGNKETMRWWPSTICPSVMLVWRISKGNQPGICVKTVFTEPDYLWVWLFFPLGKKQTKKIPPSYSKISFLSKVDSTLQ